MTSVITINGSGVPDPQWAGLLLRRPRQGDLMAGSLENAGLFLEHHPDISQRLEYNAFTIRVMVLRPFPWGSQNPNHYPRELNESDAVNFCRWLERQGQYGLSKEKAFYILGTVAEENARHPLQDWLRGIAWDNTPRCEKWLIDYLGVDDSPYARIVGKRFLVGAAARALQPGCKMDTMLIFEGAQGIGKSSAARVLFGDEYFTDSLSPIGTKDAAQEMGGKWCIEIAELAQFLKADQRHVKEMLSKSTDRFRPPYGKSPREFPRHCVFIGTYNPTANGPLKDESGARRFWPVECRKVDLEALARDRERIWAEAVDLLSRGEKWWLQDGEVKLAEVEQEARYDEDVWEELVAEHTSGIRTTTIPEVLKKMDMKADRMGKSEQMRVASCLRRLGFKKETRWSDGKARKVWVRTGGSGGKNEH
jgi:predicted P-loop ATPase